MFYEGPMIYIPTDVPPTGNTLAGDIPLLYDTRQWYCRDAPGLPLGEIKVGNLGSQMHYALSSNVWIKHECDLVDE